MASEAAETLPLTISQVAADYGLQRGQVAFAIDYFGIRTNRIGMARVVTPAHWPRLKSILERYAEARAGTN